MQYLRNQWSDFKNSWSCLILTLLWIQRYTIYSLHLNYTITLPHKTITMKITIIHRGIFFGNTRIIMTNSPDPSPLGYYVGELCLNTTRHFNPSQIPMTSWRNSCKQYGMIYHRTPSTWPYWALWRDFELVWKLGVDTLNTSSNKLFSQGFELLASCDSLKCQISMFRLIFIQAL